MPRVSRRAVAAVAVLALVLLVGAYFGGLLSSTSPPTESAYVTAAAQSGPNPLQATFTASIRVDFCGLTGAPPWYVPDSSKYLWNWKFGDGGASILQNPPAHTFSKAGAYAWQVTATMPAGKCPNYVNAAPVSHTITGSVTVTASTIQPLSVSFTAIQTGANTITFHPTIVGGVGPYVQTWTFGDGTTGAACIGDNQLPVACAPKDVFHGYDVAGTSQTYTATMTVKDNEASGATQSQQASQTFSVSSNPGGSSLQGGALTGTTLYLRATFSVAKVTGGTAPYTYAFDFGDGQKLAAQGTAGTTHYYASSGAYTAIVTVQDSIGDQIKQPASVNPLALSASESWVSKQLFVSFTSKALDAAPNATLSYAWSFGDNETSSLADPQHNYSTAGTYALKLVIADLAHAVAGNSVTIADNVTITYSGGGGGGTCNGPSCNITLAGVPVPTLVVIVLGISGVIVLAIGGAYRKRWLVVVGVVLLAVAVIVATGSYFALFSVTPTMVFV